MSGPTLTPPPTPPTVNVNMPRRGSSLGIGSIILGGLAFIICWIPLLGVVGIPLSSLGLLLGVIGILVALLRRGSSIGLPLAGSIVSAVALTVALVFTTVIVGGVRGVAHAINEDNKRMNATNQEPATTAPAISVPTPTTLALAVPATAPLAQPVQPTPVPSITATSQATLTPPISRIQPATAPSAAPPATTPSAPIIQAVKSQPASRPARPEETWAPADAPVKQGDVQIRVTSVTIGKVPLIEDIGGDNSESNDNFLSITVELTNISTTRKIDYRSFAGGDFAIERDFSTLSDNFGNAYKRVNFRTAKPVGRTPSGSLYPNKSLTDVLVFEVPIDTAEYLNLEMPASNFGGTGMIRLRIPRKMFKSAP